MTINRQLVVTFLLLLTVITFFGLTDIDLSIQDLFYNYDTKQWILGQYTQPYKFIFYDGIKNLLIGFAILIFILFLFSFRVAVLKQYQKGFIIVLLSAAIIPTTVGFLKKETNMPCPRGEIQYGGFYPRTAVWESYDDNFFLKPYHNKCWPAGHASGGFALLSLFFLFKKRKNKLIGLGIGFATGWSMGLYKMTIGDHFFSHTIITMILAWLIILLLAKAVYSIRFLK